MAQLLPQVPWGLGLVQDHGEYTWHRGHCPVPWPEGTKSSSVSSLHLPSLSHPVLGTATCLKLSMKVGGYKAALDMKKKKL